MNNPRATTPAIAALLLGAAALIGCATGRGEPVLDAIEVVLPSPRDQVQAALIIVLTEDGYPIRRETDERIVSTGYRKEISLWNPLLVSRFGVDRSRIDATITPESNAQTRMSVQVTYETKRYIWSSWQESTPALQHNAATQIRRVKRILGIL